MRKPARKIRKTFRAGASPNMDTGLMPRMIVKVQKMPASLDTDRPWFISSKNRLVGTFVPEKFVPKDLREAMAQDATAYFYAAVEGDNLNIDTATRAKDQRW